MDLLLTHGYFMRNDPAELKVNKPYPPLGLLYITAYLRERGHDVAVFDSTFNNFESFRAKLQTGSPRIVGIYVNMMTRRHALKMIHLVNESGALVVVGGPEPVNYPDEYLDAGVDLIVKGEGEAALAEIINLRAESAHPDFSAVQGLIYNTSDGTRVETPARAQTPKLDELPFPARDAIDIRRYMDHWKTHHGASSVSLITARGCPYTCRWCSHSVYGYSYRTRSPENVADEVAHIRETWNPDQLWYADDVFSINKKWLRRYADALTERNLHLPFETITREDRLDDETIDILATMGCYRLWVGAESGSQKILDAMDRRTDANRMRIIIAKLQARGIRVGTFIMFGYIGETWSDLNETHDHLVASKPDDLLTTVTYPIKGTPYFDEVAANVIATTAWADGSDADYRTTFQKSSLFYFCTRFWMLSGVRLAQIEAHGGSLAARVKAAGVSSLSRLGMYLTWMLPARRA